MTRSAAWRFGLAIVLVHAGCATVPAPAPGRPRSPLPDGTPRPAASAPASPMPGTPVGTTASGGRIVTSSPTPAVVDSAPSTEALSVLATIPEPLKPGERVPPPSNLRPMTPSTTSEPAPSAPGTSAATDSAAVDSVSSAGEANVPVPSPTAPLGDRPGSLARAGLLDSLLVPPAAPAGSNAPSTSGGLAPGAPATPGAPSGTAAPPGAAGATAASDTCWRVQVAAPPETTRAEALRDAAQSQLLMPMVIEFEKGLCKVRTRDCLATAAADSFRRRAEAAGFAGAFRFVGKRR